MQYSSAPMKIVQQSDLSAMERRLVRNAVAARKQAHAPYSHYKCGAALLDIRNRIHTGCNVETIDYTLTTHAEMDAINGMVKSGTFKLKALAVAVLAVKGPAFPCGLCRQKIREFAVSEETLIIAVGVDARSRIRTIGTATIGQLYPHAFTPNCVI